MSKVYNPYQFVPATGKVNKSPVQTTPFEYIQTGKHDFARHDVWHKNGHSGRIICRVHLVSPTFVGGRQSRDKSQVTNISHYIWGDRLAIPGNSLRGMVGATLEALSQSAMRVLSQYPQAGKKDVWNIRVPVKNGRGTEKEYIPMTVHQLFAAIASDLVPWQAGRVNLTPAELILGFVDSETEDTDVARNFASRVRFYDALPVENRVEQLEAVTLKILDSPKPPAPAMYFHKDGKHGEFVSKGAFYEDVRKAARAGNNSLAMRPNGRKVYLHQHWENNNPPGWVTRTNQRLNQKVRVEPLKAGQDFLFHIDFDNLSQEELSLLLTALCPGETFHHHLGLGKPLGLGSVCVDIAGVCLRDMENRFKPESLDGKRYATVWKECEWDEAWNTLCGERYTGELAAIANEKCPGRPDEFKISSLVDDETLKILRTLGDAGKVDPGIPVSYLVTGNQEPGYEDKLFNWFVKNERTGHQALGKVGSGKTLPALDRNPQEIIVNPQEAIVVSVKQKRLDEGMCSDWLEKAMIAAREQPGQKNMSDADILVSKVVAEQWQTLSEDEQPEYLAELQRHWDTLGVKPGKKAARIYGL